MDTTTVKSHQKRHWSVLLNHPYVWMLGLDNLKNNYKINWRKQNVVLKENAMNLIYGLQRNQTKVWYEELAYIFS